MKDLYSLVKSTSNLASLPVFDMTFACYGDGESLGCNSISGRADVGNVHFYPANGEPSISLTPSNGVDNWYELFLYCIFM
jgi:hypothetical protein